MMMMMVIMMMMMMNMMAGIDAQVAEVMMTMMMNMMAGTATDMAEVMIIMMMNMMAGTAAHKVEERFTILRVILVVLHICFSPFSSSGIVPARLNPFIALYLPNDFPHSFVN